MPRIDLITPVTYDSLWPYHSRYDNLPLEYILARQSLINSAVDNSDEILENAKGSAGTLANRLNQSLEEDGDLKDTAIDEALHKIGAHTDGEYDGIEYVRMKSDERDKLALIADEATSLTIQFETISTISTIAEFSNDTLVFQDSDTITWAIENPNLVTANMVFPDSAAHEHYYDLTPVHADQDEPDYTNYEVTNSSVAFIEGSLRVYVNGIRISEDEEVYVYNADDGPAGTWTLTSFTGDAENGTFELNRALDEADIIKIDFDRSLI
jgi:hypothetical protein